MHLSDEYCGCFAPFQSMKRTNCTSEILCCGTGVRQRYARTDVNNKRVFTVELAVSEFWYALYNLGLSISGFGLVIKGRKKRNLLWRLLSPLLCSCAMYFYIYTTKYCWERPILSVACRRPIPTFMHVTCQGHVAAEDAFDISFNHPQYSIVL